MMTLTQAVHALATQAREIYPEGVADDVIQRLAELYNSMPPDEDGLSNDYDLDIDV